MYLNEHHKMKLTAPIIIFLLTFSCYSQNEESEAKLRSKIDSTFLTEDSNSGNLRIGVSMQNGIREDWTIRSNDSSFTYQINYYCDSTVHMELYFEYKGELMYANLSEDYVPINSFDQKHWSCSFYIQKDSLVTMMSLGHGPTENPNWDPNSILTSYNKRKDEFIIMNK